MVIIADYSYLQDCRNVRILLSDIFHFFKFRQIVVFFFHLMWHMQSTKRFVCQSEQNVPFRRMF